MGSSAGKALSPGGGPPRRGCCAGSGATCAQLVATNDAAIWAAVCLGYFFLLRSREYVQNVGYPASDGTGLRGVDLHARCRGEGVPTFDQADEVTLTIRGSKTDQQNLGCTFNQFRSGDPELCVVQALADYGRHAPERLYGARACDALLVLEDGEPVTREHVQRLLKQSAIAEGLDPDVIGSHSLRIGGASALWAAYRDSALVQRWGRWSTNTWQSYVWPARENARGVSTAMAEADLGLV